MCIVKCIVANICSRQASSAAAVSGHAYVRSGGFFHSPFWQEYSVLVRICTSRCFPLLEFIGVHVCEVMTRGQQCGSLFCTSIEGNVRPFECIYCRPQLVPMLLHRILRTILVKTVRNRLFHCIVVWSDDWTMIFDMVAGMVQRVTCSRCTRHDHDRCHTILGRGLLPTPPASDLLSIRILSAFAACTVLKRCACASQHHTLLPHEIDARCGGCAPHSSSAVDVDLGLFALALGLLRQVVHRMRRVPDPLRQVRLRRTPPRPPQTSQTSAASNNINAQQIMTCR